MEHLVRHGAEYAVDQMIKNPSPEAYNHACTITRAVSAQFRQLASADPNYRPSAQETHLYQVTLQKGWEFLQQTDPKSNYIPNFKARSSEINALHKNGAKALREPEPMFV
jgi:hypothetical protein